MQLAATLQHANMHLLDLSTAYTRAESLFLLLVLAIFVYVQMKKQKGTNRDSLPVILSSINEIRSIPCRLLQVHHQQLLVVLWIVQTMVLEQIPLKVANPKKVHF